MMRFFNNRITILEFKQWALNDDEVQDFFAVYMYYQTNTHARKTFHNHFNNFFDVYKSFLPLSKNLPVVVPEMDIFPEELNEVKSIDICTKKRFI